MSLRHAALGLLAAGPASGYDLLQSFQGSLANVWPATQSQLYTELGKLADTGLVEVAAEGRRGRKEYAITAAGRAELRHWLVDVEPTPVRRSDMLLRVFFLNTLTPDEAREYLRDQLAAFGERNAAMRAVAEQIPDLPEEALVVYGKVAVEFGLRFTRMQQEWAQWAIDQLDRLPAS